MTIKHLDELTDFHLRDLERLKPGTRFLLAHVPQLKDPELRDTPEGVWGSLQTVQEVRHTSVAELYPNDSWSDDNWAQEKKPIIFYGTEEYPNAHVYASDASVVPYTGEWYNGVNFIVLLEDVEAAGITLELTPSEEYDARLKEFNTQVKELEAAFWDEDSLYGDEPEEGFALDDEDGESDRSA